MNPNIEPNFTDDSLIDGNINATDGLNTSDYEDGCRWRTGTGTPPTAGGGRRRRALQQSERRRLANNDKGDVGSFGSGIGAEDRRRLRCYHHHDHRRWHRRRKADAGEGVQSDVDARLSARSISSLLAAFLWHVAGVDDMQIGKCHIFYRQLQYNLSLQRLHLARLRQLGAQSTRVSTSNSVRLSRNCCAVRVDVTSTLVCL